MGLGFGILDLRYSPTRKTWVGGKLQNTHVGSISSDMIIRPAITHGKGFLYTSRFAIRAMILQSLAILGRFCDKAIADNTSVKILCITRTQDILNNSSFPPCALDANLTTQA